MATDLNPPEGYLVQARDGTEVSSAIIGTFLNRSVVAERAPAIPLNFKILQCRKNINSSEELLLDVRTCQTSYHNHYPTSYSFLF